MRSEKVSVCLAAYNGAQYIGEQISSILLQLDHDDQLLIIDDASTDGTTDVVKAFKDQRIKLSINTKNEGYVKTFSKLIKKAVGDYIFLSDQDDIWAPNRVERMIYASKSHRKLIVVGEFRGFTDRCDIPSINATAGQKDNSSMNRGSVKNIFWLFFGKKVSYFGSCMMLKKEALSFLLPIPAYLASHDIWIAIVGNLNSEIHHLNEVVTHRRLHQSNLTNPNRMIHEKILTRIKWLACVFLWMRRINKQC